MGRKSAAKSQAHSQAGAGAPPPSQPRSPTPLFAIGIVVVLAIVGLFAYTRSGPAVQPEQTAQAATPAVVDPPVYAKLGPHPQATLPPLPFQAYAPPRPMETVRAVYKFAAEHPEVLSYVPCFCGCERGGHRGNHDCFVAKRNAEGKVTAWEPHGLVCEVCIDVGQQAMQMTNAGASLTQIRDAIEKKYAGATHHTPTPAPPHKGGTH